MTDKQFLRKINRLGFYTTEFNWKDYDVSDALGNGNDKPHLVFVNEHWSLEIDQLEDKVWFKLGYKDQLIETRTMLSSDIYTYIDDFWDSVDEYGEIKRREGIEIFKNS